MSDLNKKILIAQLLATRDTLMATVTQIDAGLMALGVDVSAAADDRDESNGDMHADSNTDCPHPTEAVHDLSTMGEDLYRCARCGTESSTPFLPSLPSPSE